MPGRSEKPGFWEVNTNTHSRDSCRIGVDLIHFSKQNLAWSSGIFSNFNNIGLLDLALALNSHNDNNHTDRHFWKPLIWARGTSKQTFPPETKHSDFYSYSFFFIHSRYVREGKEAVPYKIRNMYTTFIKRSWAYLLLSILFVNSLKYYEKKHKTFPVDWTWRINIFLISRVTFYSHVNVKCAARGTYFNRDLRVEVVAALSERWQAGAAPLVSWYRTLYIITAV